MQNQQQPKSAGVQKPGPAPGAWLQRGRAGSVHSASEAQKVEHSEWWPLSPLRQPRQRSPAAHGPAH
jgi:hypothetical protein